jgi:hypothetical protein
MISSPFSHTRPDWGYFASDVPSPGSVSDNADSGMGADPSVTTTVIPVVVFGVAPLTAEIAPASIKLARAPINVFFMAQNLLRQVPMIEQNARNELRPKHFFSAPKTKKASDCSAVSKLLNG